MAWEPNGSLVARYIKSLAVANDWSSRIAFAERSQWTNRQPIITALKAAISAVSTTDFETALAPISTDLIELLRPQTLLGRMSGIVNAPIKTRLIEQTGGTTASWVGETQPKPLSAASFASSELAPTKVTALAVVTRELVESSDQSADQLLARDVTRAMSKALDVALVDPSNFGSAGVRPASITSNGTLIASSGSSISAIDSDLRSLINVLAAADNDFQNSYWVMNGQTAGYLGTLRGTGGEAAYPNIGPRGGILLTIPVLVSSAVETLNSPGERYIALIDAGSVLFADGGATVDLSTNASLQMLDNPATGATTHVSMFQANMVAIRGENFASFALRRAGGAATLIDVTF